MCCVAGAGVTGVYVSGIFFGIMNTSSIAGAGVSGTGAKTNVSSCSSSCTSVSSISSVSGSSSVKGSSISIGSVKGSSIWSFSIGSLDVLDSVWFSSSPSTFQRNLLSLYAWTLFAWFWTAIGHLPGCDSVWLTSSPSTFRRNVLSLSSGSRSEPSKKLVVSWGPPASSERRWTSTGLHGVTPHKTVLFIVPAVRTSNRISYNSFL
jgi:hypothetical protein